MSETLDAGIQNHMTNRSSKSPSCGFLSDSPSLPPLPIVLKFYGIGCYDVGLTKSSVCIKIDGKISLCTVHAELCALSPVVVAQ